MAPIGRRHFFAVLGSGAVGVLAGCASGGAGSTTASTNSGVTGGALTGLSFAVHRDPG